MTRILIVRSSAIGDVVFASALPGAIRRALPDAHIAWLVEPGIHELLLADPDIDEVITWPKAEWVKLWKSGRRLELLGRVRALRRDLHTRRFDIALDLQGLLKSGFLTWLSGAPRRVGLGSKEGSQLLGGEQIAVALERRRNGLDQTLRFDLRFLERAPLRVVLRVRQRIGEHLGDLVVGKTVRRLDDDTRLDARGHFARRNGEQAVGVDLETDADARCTGGHRRNAAQLKARQRTAVA